MYPSIHPSPGLVSFSPSQPTKPTQYLHANIRNRSVCLLCYSSIVIVMLPSAYFALLSESERGRLRFPSFTLAKPKKRGT